MTQKRAMDRYEELLIAEYELDTAVIETFGGIGQLPFTDWYFDHYDASVELLNCQVGFEPSMEALTALLAVGIYSVFVSYSGSEIAGDANRPPYLGDACVCSHSRNFHSLPAGNCTVCACAAFSYSPERSGHKIPATKHNRVIEVHEIPITLLEESRQYSPLNLPEFPENARRESSKLPWYRDGVYVYGPGFFHCMENEELAQKLVDAMNVKAS